LSEHKLSDKIQCPITDEIKQCDAAGWTTNYGSVTVIWHCIHVPVTISCRWTVRFLKSFQRFSCAAHSSIDLTTSLASTLM